MTCEWCGHDHPRETLCASRPKFSRRGFLALFSAGIAGLALAPLLPDPEPIPGTWGAITRSTEVWWRNQPLTFKGIPIVFDPRCPSDTYYLVNLSRLHTWTVGA